MMLFLVQSKQYDMGQLLVASQAQHNMLTCVVHNELWPSQPISEADLLVSLYKHCVLQAVLQDSKGVPVLQRCWKRGGATASLQMLEECCHDAFEGLRVSATKVPLQCVQHGQASEVAE